jgi:hypothetical protein
MRKRSRIGRLELRIASANSLPNAPAIDPGPLCYELFDEDPDPEPVPGRRQVIVRIGPRDLDAQVDDTDRPGDRPR